MNVYGWCAIRTAHGLVRARAVAHGVCAARVPRERSRRAAVSDISCRLSYNMDRLQQVCQALGPLPGRAKLQFFLSRRGSLGRASVLEALLEGDTSAVLAAATAYAEE